MSANKEDEMSARADFQKIPGITEGEIESLLKAGYRTMDDLRKAKLSELAKVAGLELNTAIRIKKYIEVSENRKAGENGGDKIERGQEEEGKEDREKINNLKDTGMELEKELQEIEKELEEVFKTEERAKAEKGAEETDVIVIEKKVKLSEIREKPKIRPVAKPVKKSRFYTGFAYGVVVILIFSSLFVIWYALQPQGRIKIDGNIDDWEGIVKYADTETAQNPDINLNEYSVYYENDRVYFYGRVSGSLFNGANDGYDALVIFVDADGNPNTGYKIENLGADAKIEVTGYGGEIRSASVSRFIEQSVSARPELNYSAWENTGEVRAEKTDRIVEGYAKVDGLENPVSLVVMRHYEGSTYA
ncbi:MAG: hypothetical protein N3F63_06485, partial [Thermoplasmata archaeon]|nr:hypothetical protein [Thermoplasmata archaeon]